MYEFPDDINNHFNQERRHYMPKCHQLILRLEQKEGFLCKRWWTGVATTGRKSTLPIKKRKDMRWECKNQSVWWLSFGSQWMFGKGVRSFLPINYLIWARAQKERAINEIGEKRRKGARNIWGILFLHFLKINKLLFGLKKLNSFVSFCLNFLLPILDWRAGFLAELPLVATTFKFFSTIPVVNFVRIICLFEI